MNIITEENELSTIDLDVAERDDIDERIILLAEALDTDPFYIEKSEWGAHNYEIVDGEHEGEEYTVLTDSEADEAQRDYARETLEEVGFKDCGLDISNYVSDDYCEDTMRDIIESDANEMSDDDLLDELLRNEVISLDDEEWFELKNDVDTEDEDFDVEDINNYELKKSRGELENAYIDWKESDDLVEMFWDYGYGDCIEDDVEYSFKHNHNFPYYIEEEQAIEDLIRWNDRAQDLSGYDGSELDLGKNSDGEYMYAYRKS